MSEKESMDAIDEDIEGGERDELSGVWGMLSEEQRIDLKKLWEKDDEKMSYIG